jgi:hypothetical protein
MAHSIWRRALTRPVSPRRRQARLQVETLEARALPSTLTVTNLSDADPGSLRAALTQAQPGDTIDFASGLNGTIVLTSGELRIDQSVSIAGPGVDQITVSGGNSSRVVEVTAGTQVSISGLAITGGRFTASGAGTFVGAGIANYGNLTLTACDISGNSIGGSSNALALGTGIYNAGNLTLTNCQVSRNTAAVDNSEGAGIWNGTGSLSLTDCTVSANNAGGIGGGAGGGLFNAGGMASVTDCTFSDNTTTRPSGSGGGIDNDSGVMTVIDSLFMNNIAAWGAGLYNETAGNLTVTGSTLAMNHANFPGSAGGGLYNNGHAKLTNCTVTANAPSGTGSTGGGVYNGNHGMVALTSCTLTANSASDPFDSVGGIQADGTVQLLNTIVAGNISHANKPDVFGMIQSLGYNLIGVDDGTTAWMPTDLVGTAANPLHPALAPLGDYGGPTPTMPLLAGSPALDAGDPSWLGSPDQRGVTRGGGVNIGAFQATATQFVLDAPTEVTAGVPFDVTVTATDPYGNVAVGYTGTASLYATDPQAPYQGTYTYTLADGGSYVFIGVTLMTPGPQTLVAGDGPLVGLADVMVDSAASSRSGRGVALAEIARSWIMGQDFGFGILSRQEGSSWSWARALCIRV